MTSLFLLPFIALCSANAAPETTTNKPKEQARFRMELNRNDFNAPIRSREKESYMGIMHEEDYTAPFQIEIFDLNTESTKSTYTVSHRYHMRVSCHTIGKKRLDTLEYMYWTESVPLYENDRVFASDEKEFYSRKTKRDFSPLEAFISFDEISAACSVSVEESVYSVHKDGNFIKDIILVPESGC